MTDDFTEQNHILIPGCSSLQKIQEAFVKDPSSHQSIFDIL